MKSRIYFLPAAIAHIKRFIKSVSRDKVTVHAAGASFFVITSAVPFISLLIAIIGAFLPEWASASPVDHGAAGELSEILGYLRDELSAAPSVPLISISAVASLWSASRGVGAVRDGIETVYHAERAGNFLTRKLKSLLSTVLFIALIVSISALILFGDFIIGSIGAKSAFMEMRIPVFIVAVCAMFTLIYSSVAKRSTYVKHCAIYHLPGALVSSIGWVVFSYFYSLYITNFPSASYVYGSLAAVCLIMLWLYFCMIILLFGAEINKLYFAGEKYSKQGDV